MCLRFVLLFLQGRSQGLSSNGTTEEALSLIKEEEVLGCCNYAMLLKQHVTDDTASFMFQLKGKRDK